MTDIDDVYEDAGITGDIGFGDSPAIVVVDLQTAFTDPECSLGSDLDETVEANAELLETAREHDVPVFFTRCVYREDARDGAVFAEKIPSTKELTRDSPWLEIDPRLNPTEADHIVEKQQPSGFFETELDTMLTFEGVDTAVITGATTSGCVRATVVDACSHGYRPIVPVECVGDRAEDPHEANLFDMGSKYADLMGLEETKETIRETVRD
jgi:nicotinamidase-related amidase